MDLSADPGLVLLAYTAEAGSTSEDALRMLASWAATQEHHSSANRSPAPDEH
jgi:hypothetical protein